MSIDILFYLFLFLFLAWVVGSIVIWTIINGISPMPSAPAASKTMFSNFSYLNLIDGVIYDLGAGWGSLIFPLAKEYPDHKVIGYENSPIPFLFCLFRYTVFAGRNLSIYRKNFYNVSLHDAALVVCYLYPGAMVKLKDKFEKELRPGSYVVSNTFGIPGWTPYDVWIVNDIYQTKIYVYRIPSSIPPKT